MRNKISLVCVFFLILVFSCKKKKDDCSSCASGEGVKPQPGLSFVLNGSTTTLLADSAWFVPASKTIVAYYQAGTHKLVIKTSAQVAAKYTVSPLNTLTYTENSLVYTATSGEINISENTGTKLSGDFLTLGNSGGFTSVKGSFIDLPKR